MSSTLIRKARMKPRKAPMSRVPFRSDVSGNYGGLKRDPKKVLGTARQRPDGTRALGKECDKWTSRAVRLQTPYCVLCKERRWRQLTNGHMFKRGVQSVRYDYLPGGNCHTLCRECNRKDSERRYHDRYVFWFVKTYGSEAFAALRDRACAEERKWEPDELRQMIAERKAKVEELRLLAVA
jgi:hypothetical protein